MLSRGFLSFFLSIYIYPMVYTKMVMTKTWPLNLYFLGLGWVLSFSLTFWLNKRKCLRDLADKEILSTMEIMGCHCYIYIYIFHEAKSASVNGGSDIIDRGRKRGRGSHGKPSLNALIITYQDCYVINIRMATQIYTEITYIFNIQNTPNLILCFDYPVMIRNNYCLHT